MSIFIATVIFVLILSEFLKIVKETISNLLSLAKVKTIFEKEKIKRILFIKLTFLLPWELLNLLATFVFAFFVFHLFSSSLIFIALVSLLFKEIFSEIPYLLISMLIYFLKKPIHLEEDPYIKNTEIIPSNFFSSLYIPQKAESISNVYAGITQGLRTLNNNLKPYSNLIFIYHSDTEEDSLIEEEIRLIVEAKEEFGEKVFLFARNRNAYNPFFLRKPGGYMSDYQILTTGIWHPLNYLSSSFDARRQKVLLSDGETKDHIPFYSIEYKNNPKFFIHYKENLFLKEKINIIKIFPEEEMFKDVKIISQIYLVNKDNPKEYYPLSQGKILSPQGEVLFYPQQWKIDPEGRIRATSFKENYFLDKFFDFVFVQILYLNDEKKLLLNEVANLIDMDTGKIWAKREEYKIEFSYDLYKLENKRFYLLKENFSPENKIIKGKDYRRLVFDRMTAISWENLKNLVKEKIISFSQAEEFMEKGIVGNIYNLHIGKKGLEKEYFVKDPLIKFKERVFGGYIVKKSSGFNLDKEGNLIFEHRLVELKENIKEVFIYKEKELSYLIYKEKDENFFVRYADTNKKVLVDPKEEYFYILNPWINKIKVVDSGFIVNEKDGFYLDKEGNLWYIGDVFEKYVSSPLPVAEKDKVEDLVKEIVFVEYKDNSLKKNIFLAEAGGWYRDNRHKFRLRKIISLKDFVYFDEKLNAIVINPLEKKITIYPLGTYSLGEVYLWENSSENNKIVEEENIFIKDGNLIKEEIIAKEKEYYFNEKGEVVLSNGEKIPYGIFLRFRNGEILKDRKGNFVSADCGIKIINQTDADAEFQPRTLPYLNSKLIRNLREEEPYLMLQPEISFGNQGQSIFARFHYWAQQMYRFMGRAIFSLYRESSAYGKMTKWVEDYVKNILFKEVIPPLARTHDHWEAMYLKTALIYSYPNLKSKNLMENTPPNYFSFLKRLEGWIGGDLILLEHETYFGLFIDFLRIILSLLKLNFREAKFWLNHTYSRIKHLEKKTDNISYYSKILRIWLIKRLAFSPFYYGLWLILVGTISLIIPGFLTIKNTQIAWMLFWSVIIVLICLPKIVIPFLERFFIFEKRRAKLITFIFLIFASFFINNLGKTCFEGWSKFTTLLIFLYLFQNLIIYLFKSIFSLYPGIVKRLAGISIFSLIGFFIWTYTPSSLNWLENIPSAKWIFLVFLKVIPSYAGFFLILIILLEIVPGQRMVLNFIKKGLMETIYSSSILLLNIIYIPMIVFSKIHFMLFNPHQTIPWFTSPFVEKILGKKVSLFETYARLIWAPIISLSFAIIPVCLGLADLSLIFYGWPIFIWSWIFGPFLTWFSGNFGKTLTFSSLEFLGIRDKLLFLKNSMNLNREKINEVLLDYNLRLNHVLSSQELLSLYLYFITDIEKISPFQDLKEYLDKELLPENLREYDWKTLNALGRARILLKISKYKNCIPREETKMIKTMISLIKILGINKPAFPDWEELSFNQKERLIKKVIRKHKISEEEKYQIEKLLQFFEKKDLKRLYIRLKKAKSINEFINTIPDKFFYLKKALEEIGKTYPLPISLYQKRFLIALISERYNLKQKAYDGIINLYLKLISSSETVKNGQK